MGVILPLGLMNWRVGGRVGNGALDEGWSAMKCARVWVGRQRLLFLSFSGRIITLHPDSLTFETRSSKENVDGGSRAALVVLDRKVCGSQPWLLVTDLVLTK